MNEGLCKGNYFDYDDDEVARQREADIVDNHSPLNPWTDPNFPPSPISLYFDPFNPPKGLLPAKSIRWFRICKNELEGCFNPVDINCDHRSPTITQGTLGDKYFVNALRLMACQPKYIKRLLVSDKFKDRGIYTLKFYKEGRWRYVHIDDHIPCSPSGKINFCRNRNRNELFAMLIEKAYAKLHGSYEAIANGRIEVVLHDLTPAAHSQCLRLEDFKPSVVCDTVWNAIEKALNEDRLVGCMRFVEDPYADNINNRQGITLGHMYHVIDAVVASAEPTEELDAITVGMICVQNVQFNQGRFTGRWSFQHDLWAQYPEIAYDLRKRTRAIQHKRGLGVHPDEYADTSVGVDSYTYLPYDEGGKQLYKNIKNDQDDLDLKGFTYNVPVKLIQPTAQDLHWIQIEDFVDVFNRLYIVNDQSWNPKGGCKRYMSSWVPGDFIAGSGGPPVALETEAESAAKAAKAKRQKEFKIMVDETADDGIEVDDGQVALPDVVGDIQREGQLLPMADDANADANAGSNAKPEQATAAMLTEDDFRKFDDAGDDFGGNLENDDSDGEFDEDKSLQQSDDFGDLLEVEEDPDPDAAGESKAIDGEIDPRLITLNENFTDNPMYPFSVSEVTNVSVTVYQADRRWSVERLGSDPRNTTSSMFRDRDDRLLSCTRYDVGLGFLLVKLSGSKMRLTEFLLKKIVGRCDAVEFSNLVSANFDLRPGRYAVIPFTHQALSAAMTYVLHVQYVTGSVDFEVTDLQIERPIDNVLSDNEDSEVDDDDEEEEGNKKDTQTRAAIKAARAKIRRERALLLPKLLEVKQWEFHEETEELGLVNMFDEVGSIAQYLRGLTAAYEEGGATLASLRQDLAAAVARKEDFMAKQAEAAEAAAAAAAKAKSSTKRQKGKVGV